MNARADKRKSILVNSDRTKPCNYLLAFLTHSVSCFAFDLDKDCVQLCPNAGLTCNIYPGFSPLGQSVFSAEVTYIISHEVAAPM